MKKVVFHTLEPTIKKVMQTDVRSSGKDERAGSLKLNSSLCSQILKLRGWKELVHK